MLERSKAMTTNKPILRWLTAASALLGLAWFGGKVWTNHHRAHLIKQDHEAPPTGMVFVPAGEFWMGSSDPSAEPDERPLRKVFVPAFYIDRFEVTNRRYQELVPSHRFLAGEEDLPVTHVLKREAEEYCRRAGSRLPRNAEWEKAARGVDGRAYPWGNEFDSKRANIDRRRGGATNSSCRLPSTNSPSHGKLVGGSFPTGASPYGCHDMAGNVWEWVSDVWRDPSTFGLMKLGDSRGVIRGGAYSYTAIQARTSYQGFEALDATCHDVGFRCAMDAVPKQNGPKTGRF